MNHMQKPSWAAELLTWLKTEGMSWAFVLKTTMAALLAMWVAMRLEMPQPFTVVMTVFIAMQPQSGQVLAKGVFRMVGTLAGFCGTIPIIALFSQESTMMMLCLCLWAGICTAGSARYRDFRSYACILAGYTAFVISLSVIEHPDMAFTQAMWRFVEIATGVFFCTLLNAIVFPVRSGPNLRALVRKRFGEFASHTQQHLKGDDAEAFANANTRFASETVKIEIQRSVSGYDDPLVNMRMGRIHRLNQDFLALTTRFHTLKQLLGRLRKQHNVRALEAIDPCLDSLLEVLKPWAQQTLSTDQAALLANQLFDYRQQLMEMIREARQPLDDLPGNSQIRMDFNTAAELLYRLADDLHNYSVTHASLGPDHHPLEHWSVGFAAKANPIAALLTGLRMFLLLAACSWFWIQTDWKQGAMFTTTAAIVMALASTSNNPARVAIQICQGTVIAAVLGFLMTFFYLPKVSSFAMLALGLAVVYVPGLYIATRPRFVGLGTGLVLFFAYASVPGNFMVHDPVLLINKYIAMIAAMLMAITAILVFCPTNSRWMWRQLARDLRLQVVSAVRDPLPSLPYHFETSTRDLMTQAHELAASRPDVQRSALHWMYLSLEIGQNFIELRQELYQLRHNLEDSLGHAWPSIWKRLKTSLVTLFERPTQAHFQHTLNVLEEAITQLQRTPLPLNSHFATSPSLRLESYLHFIRSSLLDPQSPLSSKIARQRGRHA